MSIFLARPLRWRYCFHPSSLKLDRITSRLRLDKQYGARQLLTVYQSSSQTRTTTTVPFLVCFHGKGGGVHTLPNLGPDNFEARLNMPCGISWYTFCTYHPQGLRDGVFHGVCPLEDDAEKVGLASLSHVRLPRSGQATKATKATKGTKATSGSINRRYPTFSDGRRECYLGQK